MRWIGNVRAMAVCVMFIAVTSSHAADESPFGAHVQLRGSLDNSRLKFERERKGTIAFIGGSITEMNGYRPMMYDRLKKRFPQTEFTFVDAGISSTTSITGAFRAAHDVFAKGPIDLFFVEFAVNDDQDGHYSRQECLRGMEGIIRHAREVNPNVDIVMTFFVNEPMLKALQEGKTPLTIEVHGAVAEHYRVPTIDLAAEAADRISHGTLTWKTYGGVHPAPLGNSICADMIDELFNRAWNVPLSAGAAAVAHPLPAPLDTLSYFHGRFIEPKEAKIVSGWTLGIPDWKSIKGGKRDRFTKIDLLSATEPNAELTLAFDGTAVGAFIVAGPDAGQVETSIDSGPYQITELFHAYSAGLHYPRTVVFADGLPPGAHNLRLRTAASSSTSGHAARIIEFVAN